MREKICPDFHEVTVVRKIVTQSECNFFSTTVTSWKQRRIGEKLSNILLKIEKLWKLKKMLKLNIRVDFPFNTTKKKDIYIVTI